MHANKESYETQIKSLKEQRIIEKQKIKELNLKYKEVLAKIEEKYSKKEKDLSRKEKNKIKEIVTKAKDNPVEINEKIENIFGFTSDN
jgi:cytochrome c-type biogenesis protein CcmE